MENDTNANYYGGFWYSYMGGTPATVWPASGANLTPSAGGANGTLYAMRVTGTVGVAGTTYPCVGMGSQFTATSGSPTYTTMDISACTGIKFYTKSDLTPGSSYLVKIPYTDTTGASLTGYNDYEYVFTAPATWTQLTVPFALMSQAAGWGTSAVLTTVLQHAKEMQFQSNFNAVAPATSAPVDLWVDEVVIYGCPSCPAAPTPYPTSTSTLGVPTNTFTNTPTMTNTVAGPTNTFTLTVSVPTNTPTLTNTVGAATNTPTFTNTVGAATSTSTPVGGGCNFDDMENDTNANYYGGFWYSYMGGTPATVWPASGANLTPSAGGANGTLYAMRVTGTVGVAGTTYPCVGMGSQFTATSGSPTYTTMDISACTGIKFYTKSDLTPGSSYLVKIPYTDTTGASLTGYNDYEYVFTAPATWTQLTVPFALMSQAAGWGTSAVLTTVLQHAKEMQFQSNFNAVAPATSAPVDLWVDEVVIYGCPSCPAAPTPYPTSTSTLGVPTNTFTNTPTMTNTVAGPTNTFTLTVSVPTNTPTLTYTATVAPTATTSTNPSLSVSIIAPTSATVGQYVTITVQVMNNGSVNLTNINTLNFTTGISTLVLSPVSTPSVATSLTTGQSVDLNYVYLVNAGGTASVQSQAEGTNLNPNDVISSSASNGPLSISLSLGSVTPTPSAIATWPVFKIMTPTPMPGETPIYIIGSNPNPTPGVQVDREINIWVSQSIQKIEYKIYSKAGRLVRYYVDYNSYQAGVVKSSIPGGQLTGLARGAYFLVISATADDGTVGKSSIEKLLIF
jgi:hypothetical protein